MERSLHRFRRKSPLFLARNRNRSVGFASVYSPDQSLEEQVSLLAKYGCHLIFQEVLNSRSLFIQRPQLLSAMNELKKGDEFVVNTLTSFSRNQNEILGFINELQKSVNSFTMDESLSF